MRFVEDFCNILISNELPREWPFGRSTSRPLRCETCLTAVRNMANRDSKHGRSHHALACIATRKTPNRVRFLHFRNRNLAKTAISLAGLRKNPAQVSNQNSWQRPPKHRAPCRAACVVAPFSPRMGPVEGARKGSPGSYWRRRYKCRWRASSLLDKVRVEGWGKGAERWNIERINRIFLRKCL